jgi:hypothetical protein
MLLRIVPNDLVYEAPDKWTAKARADELVRTGGTQIIHWTLTDDLWPTMEPEPVWAVWVQGQALVPMFSDRGAALQALAAALAEPR